MRDRADSSFAQHGGGRQAVLAFAAMNVPRPQSRCSAIGAWMRYDAATHSHGLMIPDVAYAIYFASRVNGDSGKAGLLG